MRKGAFQLFAHVIHIILLAGMVSCTAKPQPPTSEAASDRTVITFAAPDSQKNLFTPIISEFNQSQTSYQVIFSPFPIPFEAPGASSQDYLALMAGSGDTFLMSGGISRSALFLDMQPLIDMDSAFDSGDFWSGSLGACADTQGRQLGVPIGIRLYGIFYDPSAFEQAGLALPAPGWTGDDLISSAVALTHPVGDSIRYGLAENSISLAAPTIAAAIAKNNGQVDPQAMQVALQPYLDLLKSGSVFRASSIQVDGETDWQARWDQWFALFTPDVRPAMWIGGLDEEMPAAIHQSADAGNPLAMDVDRFAPFPVSMSDSRSQTNPAFVTCAAINPGTKAPQAAWEWVKFLSSRRIGTLRTRGVNPWMIPPRKSVAGQGSFWQELPEQIRPVVQFALDNLWAVSEYPLAVDTVNRAIDTSVREGIDLRAALETPQSASEPVAQPSGANSGAAPDLPPSVSADAVEVNYMFTGVYESASIQALVQSFNDTHKNIRINLSGDTQLSPIGEDPLSFYAGKFDCFTIYWLYMDADNAQKIYDLGPYLETAGTSFVQDFYPMQMDKFRLDGRQIALPAFNQPVILSYNADLLASLGLQAPGVDWSFNDFIHLATQAAASTGSEPTYGFVFNELEMSNLLFAGLGARWIDYSSYPPQANFDSSEIRSALVWLQDAAQTNVLLAQNETNWDTIDKDLQSGRVAFWLSYAGNPSGYYSPQMGFNIGIAPFPTVEEKDFVLYFTDTWGHYISRQAQHPEACWEWLKFLSEQPNAFSGVPARISVLNSPAWVAAVGERNAQVFRKAASQLSGPSSLPAISRFDWPVYYWRNKVVRSALQGEDFHPMLSELNNTANIFLTCAASVNPDQLTESQVIDKVNACARQADPNLPW